MRLNFMQIEDVVMSGDGFVQSMAYHAYTHLALTSFVLQCAYCIAAIGLGYVGRRLMCRQLEAHWPRQTLLHSLVRNAGPAALACASMSLALAVVWAVHGDRYDLLVIWKVMSLTLWVLGVRLASWVFRRVMRPHELLRFFLWLIEWSLVLVMVLTFFGCFQPMVQAVDSVRFSVGDQVFKGANILSGLVMAVVAFTVAAQLAQWVDWGLNKYSGLKRIQPNDALILTRLFSFGIFAAVGMGVLVSSGIEPTTLAAFAGAMGIGLGFGMQEMVINFFSGLYILFERAMKVGDYVTINNITGRVVQLTSRAVMVRDAVGTESLIPNSELTKSILQNHTLSNDDFRVSFSLKISDIASFPAARELILQALQKHPRVLMDQPLGVELTAIAADEVKLEVSCWINDLQNGQKGLISDLLYEAGISLRAHGVLLAGTSSATAETIKSLRSAAAA